jgi:iron complex transport system permease protein
MHDIPQARTLIQPKAKLQFSVLMIGAICFLFFSLTISIMLGPVPIQPGTVWRIAFSHLPMIGEWIPIDWNKAQGHIIWDIRFPRVLLGAIIGAGLAVVGVAIQALVRNPLADPYILGVSSGASVAAALVLLFGAFHSFGQYALSISAFLGSLLAICFVFLLAQENGRISTVRLLLSGIAVSLILSALTSFIVMIAPREEMVRSVLFWMLGSFSQAKWEYLVLPALFVVIGILLLFLQARPMNALLMGEEAAATLGVNTNRFRQFLLIITSLLTGVMVAVSGSIGFVGLMMPHIVRLLVGSDHRRVLPLSVMLGASFMIWADVAARTIIAPEELPIGIVTALCGGPFFIWLLRRSSYSFGGQEK